MSPEQARGLKVDARTDIFSLGVVLYELIAGRAPFDGATSSDIMAAILEKNPPALSTFGEFPEELQWILTKALAKDRDERYQTAKELLTDLKRIKKQLDVYEELRRSDPSAIVQTVHKTKWVIPALLALIVIASIYFLYSKTSSKIVASKIPFSKIQFTRLTSNNRAGGTAISPDGKYVAYFQEFERNRAALYLRQLAAGTDIQILALQEGNNFWGAPVFSNDGEYIYYMTWQPPVSVGVWYQIPVLGGVPRKVMEDVESVAISPDGKKMVFVRFKNEESFLMIVDADGKNPQKIASQKEPKWYGALDWSPDGKMIALMQITSVPSGRMMQIIGIDLRGSQRILSDVKWFCEWDLSVSDLKWLSDGRGLLFTKYEAGRHQIYYLSYPDGRIERITHDPNDYWGISLTKNNKSLVTMNRSYSSIISTASADNPDSVEQLSFGSGIDDGATGLSWTPQGKILFHSNAPSGEGEFQLWVMNADGSDRKRITTGKDQKYWPVSSPDGRYLVYMSTEEEAMRMWRVDSNGDNPILLSSRKVVRWPRISADSKWVFCSTTEDNKQQLLKISIDGSQQKVLATHLFIGGVTISPDGKQIAYPYRQNDTSPLVMNIISPDGGVPIRSFTLEDDVIMAGPRYQWTPDGSAIAYIRWDPKGTRNIFVKPIDGSTGRFLTNFKEDLLENFSWSFDGKKIAYSRLRLNNHVVLMQDIP